MIGRRIGIVPHKIARSFYLKYPYQTIDEKFLPEKEKIFHSKFQREQSPAELYHYLENEEIGGKIRNSNGEIRRDEHCLDYGGTDVILYPCHGVRGNQWWIYDTQNRQSW